MDDYGDIDRLRLKHLTPEMVAMRRLRLDRIKERYGHIGIYTFDYDNKVEFRIRRR